jgi:hypothetical protein
VVGEGASGGYGSQPRAPVPRAVQRIYLVVATPSVPVSDHKTFGGVSQFPFTLFSCDRKRLILNGEMSEWLSASAAKPLRRDISP